MARSPLSVLVVEDEPLVRIVVVEELESLGFAVTEADSARAARRVVEGGRALTAAVVDVGLPDARGDELAREIRGLWPATAIVLVSGYDEDTLRQRFTDFDRIAFLSKPYLASDLVAVLRRFGIQATVPTASSAPPAL
jgi:CheY-like chemotaxis protein